MCTSRSIPIRTRGSIRTQTFRRSWRALAALSAALVAALALVLAGGGAAGAAVTAGGGRAVTAAAARPAGDGPTGFWWGSDSWPIPVSGSAPYSMPRLGGAYGGYIGMTGNWAYWFGCGGQEHFLAYSSANAAQAHTNYVTYHRGIGDGAYWFMGGPGVDPHYNGTAAEASTWGARQAARALSDIAKQPFDLKIVWMDVELPGITPAPDNGWNSVYTSPCSGVKKQSYIPVSVDRAEFNGFANYVTSHSPYKAGVYSAPSVWTKIFGTGSAAQIPNTYEWTYEPETAHLSDAPHGWCLTSGGCAQFFGGQTSSGPYALMWQWSGGGGVRNGVGDFDQIDGGRQVVPPAREASASPRNSCGGFNGNVSWGGNSAQIHVWGVLWNNHCPNARQYLYVSYTNAATHYNRQIGNAPYRSASNTGINWSASGKSYTYSNIAVDVCDNSGGWHCGTPKRVG